MTRTSPLTALHKVEDYYAYICLDTLLDSLRDEAKLTRIGEIMAMQKIHVTHCAIVSC